MKYTWCVPVTSVCSVLHMASNHTGSTSEAEPSACTGSFILRIDSIPYAVPVCLPAFLTHSVQLWWTRSRETLLGHLWNVLRLIGWQHCNDKSHICGKIIFPIEWAACFFLKWVHEISNYTKWRKHEESVTFSYSLRKSNTDCFCFSAAQTSNAYNLWASIYVFKCKSESPQPATGLTEANIYAHFHIRSQFRNNK